jgi:hypothetical protein
MLKVPEVIQHMLKSFYKYFDITNFCTFSA